MVARVGSLHRVTAAGSIPTFTSWTSDFDPSGDDIARGDTFLVLSEPRPDPGGNMGVRVLTSQGVRWIFEMHSRACAEELS